ncbi:MAG: FAD-dependent oxidoreductase, partial [Planctomycetaceae bacterium]|nr:FAD-dependent oxidoreductase [Planctomycetaceae bacterium]
MKHSRRHFIQHIMQSGIGIGALSAVGTSHASEVSFVPASEKVSAKLPVFGEADICVLGGSCTGVFAAVRAARLGAKVILVEKLNAFGGVATNSLVNVWHSVYDTTFKLQIIAGLTTETMERLKKRNAVTTTKNNPSRQFTFNSQELKIELDEIVLENKIQPYLNTLFSEPYFDDDGKLAGVIVDGKSGRGVIRAKYFIDATGDGDLCARLGLEVYVREMLQPPTTCAHFSDWDFGVMNKNLKEHGAEFQIPSGFVWGTRLPETYTTMVAGTRIFGADCSVADELTKAEIEGRRQIRAIMDMMRKYSPDKKCVLTALPSYTGIRESRHVKCLFEANDDDALHGKRYDDAIANGSYRFDQHHQDKPGITFRY